jgi:hypothetical protein
MEAKNGRREGTFLVKDGCNARLTGDLRRVLGLEPGDVADYACEAAAPGVWAGIY